MAEAPNFDDMNISELVVMASFQDFNVHRGIPREVLVSIIMGDSYELPPRHIDIWRYSIFAFVDAHWEQCSPLLPCPMKERVRHACFKCPDAQVAECVLSNHKTLIQAVQLHRKEIP